MDSTILDKCDLEDYSDEELFDLYGILITEVSKRELTQKFDERMGF